MNIGMMLFDRDSTTSLVYKIEQAIKQYQTKYGHLPDYCEVHFENDLSNPFPIEVVGRRYILPYHIWLGMKEQNHVSLQEEKKEYNLEHGEM